MKLNKLNVNGTIFYEVSFRRDFAPDMATTIVLYDSDLKPIAMQAMQYMDETKDDCMSDVFWFYSKSLCKELEGQRHLLPSYMDWDAYSSTIVSPEILERLVDEVLQDRLPTLPYKLDDSKLNGFIQEHGIPERD